MDPNWVDFIILAVILYYAYDGYSSGFVSSLLGLISFVASFVIGLKYYEAFGEVFVRTFSIPQTFSNAIGFFILSFLTEITIGLVLRKILSKKLINLNIINRLLGIVPGVFSGLVILTFLLTLIISLPLSAFLKNSVLKSFIGRELVGRTQGFEKELNNIFGGAVNETLNFLTVDPKSNESVALTFKVSDFSEDRKAEQEMLALVNKERLKQGITSVVFDEQLAQVGRDHCEDMLKRRYFSHYTQEGLSPFDRMINAGISFNFAGENLALAPDVELAMQGLMNSPGHKENILSPNFGKLGVGVIDGGIYGQMFCQEFTD
ncbi:MAG: hypothetical protein A3D74_01270 [Candidatus Levybacteria bacterium RIFCSPHIGHO2_02_FULL_37_13]|nr:MAG: hypothetical protein A3D74_01270 [Candidatus Levybacteria bacterium RIFCSPHIGHO2_02_FULL_37_13]OGH30630.1 MAG: hypothetical protein A3E40_02105 [Candidatus Levybacteria bacterium RIFCSPHIGHO2_12_FULL_37_9]OGH37394.1 MAG: hypothetical protein A3B41_01320 [Candidatus Levybacteria bacterium RIFCSPLOWO2_01_FULL_37_26]